MSSRAVLAYELGVSYDSVKEASKAHFVSEKAIYRALRHKTTCAGLHWFYGDEEPNVFRFAPSQERPVIRQDGRWYRSLSEAASDAGTYPAFLKSRMKAGLSFNGYVYQYAKDVLDPVLDVRYHSVSGIAYVIADAFSNLLPDFSKDSNWNAIKVVNA